MRLRFRYLLVVAVVVLGAGGYVAYWYYLANQVEPLVAAWARERRAEGFRVGYGPITVEGFPFRLIVRIEAPDIAGGPPESPWHWQGERLGVVAQPWRLRHLIFSFDGLHRLFWQAGGERRAASLRADVPLMSVVTDRTGRIERLALDFQGVVLRDERLAEPYRAKRAQLHARAGVPDGGASETRPQGEVSVRLDEVSLPAALEAPLGHSIARLAAEARLIEPIPEAPLAQALEAWRAAGGAVEIEALTVNWGPLKSESEGTVALDEALRPMGAGTVRLEGHRETISALRDAGLIGGGEALAARAMLAAISRQSPDGALRVPVRAQNGVFYLGPVPLLALPPVLPSKK